MNENVRKQLEMRYESRFVLFRKMGLSDNAANLRSLATNR
jgi:hypothetical protein